MRTPRFTTLLGTVRHQPLRLLPLFLGLFLLLFFTAFVAVTGRFGRKIADELPEDSVVVTEMI